MRIAVAQINLHVGDIGRNTDRIVEFAQRARREKRAGLVVFPELAVTGYPPEDLLLRPGLHRQVLAALARIQQASADVDILVGYPEARDGAIYNSCAYLRAGAMLADYRKRVLPNYGVFDEKRYFTSGERLQFVDLGGVTAALSICEDLWTPQHAVDCARAGASLLLNINASPYHERKQDERIQLLQRRHAESGLAVVYGNLVGGQDELVFDGGTLAMDASGKLVLAAPQFEEGIWMVDAKPAKGGVQLASPDGVTPPQDRVENIHRALVLGIRDYVSKNRFKGAVLGLSGGVDSAVTLCLAVEALGADNVEALLMPSRYTSSMSIEDARTLADNLGVRHDTVSIEAPFQAFCRELASLFRGLPEDTTEENIQARCRGVILMACSNKTGRMVLATGNKSEMSVGYATLYGDMAGGFAPLKDVFKTTVFQLAHWCNRERTVIPRRIIERPPSAELRPDQKDEDSLPPYDVLDPILERYVEQDLSPEEIMDAGFSRDTVRRVVEMVDHNEYKRRQAPPGIKISRRAFGRDRRYPITSLYREP